MARNGNCYICGQTVATSVGSYWGPGEVAAYVRALKATDPHMIVALYPTSFCDALRAALEAAGMRWRHLNSIEQEGLHSNRKRRDREYEARRDPVKLMESRIAEIEGIRLVD